MDGGEPPAKRLCLDESSDANASDSCVSSSSGSNNTVGDIQQSPVGSSTPHPSENTTKTTEAGSSSDPSVVLVRESPNTDHSCEASSSNPVSSVSSSSTCQASDSRGEDPSQSSQGDAQCSSSDLNASSMTSSCTSSGSSNNLVYESFKEMPATVDASSSSNVEPLIQSTTNQSSTDEPSVQSTTNQSSTVEPSVQSTTNQSSTVEPSVQSTTNQSSTVEPSVQSTTNQSCTVSAASTLASSSTSSNNPTQSSSSECVISPSVSQSTPASQSEPVSQSPSIPTSSGSHSSSFQSLTPSIESVSLAIQSHGIPATVIISKSDSFVSEEAILPSQSTDPKILNLTLPVAEPNILISDSSSKSTTSKASTSPSSSHLNPSIPLPNLAITCELVEKTIKNSLVLIDNELPLSSTIKVDETQNIIISKESEPDATSVEQKPLSQTSIGAVAIEPVLPGEIEMQVSPSQSKSLPSELSMAEACSDSKPGSDIIDDSKILPANDSNALIGKSCIAVSDEQEISLSTQELPSEQDKISNDDELIEESSCIASSNDQDISLPLQDNASEQDKISNGEPLIIESSCIAINNDQDISLPLEDLASEPDNISDIRSSINENTKEEKKSPESSQVIESMEVDKISEGDDIKMDTGIPENSIGCDEIDNGDKKSLTETSISEQPFFLDEESCEPILRKPEPVSNIREETLAGDPRLESLETTTTCSGSQSLTFIGERPSADGTDENDDTSMSMKEKLDGEEEEEDEDEEAVIKKPKKRKKPRRSVYYRPRPDKKKKEKEKGNVLYHCMYVYCAMVNFFSSFYNTLYMSTAIYRISNVLLY